MFFLGMPGICHKAGAGAGGQWRVQAVRCELGHAANLQGVKTAGARKVGRERCASGLRGELLLEWRVGVKARAERWRSDGEGRVVPASGSEFWGDVVPCVLVL